MTTETDSYLLKEFADFKSERAFATLVTRHINLVYSVALRQIGDPHQADEVTQAVFIILARKAGELRSTEALSSWLFQTTRLTAKNFLRTEIRRRARENAAYMQSIATESNDDLPSKLMPLLDAAVEALRETDRKAIVLRFYEGRSLEEIGKALQISEDAAKKRVGRALEKLRSFFARRGVALTVTTMATVISSKAVQAAPAGLANTLSAAAAAGSPPVPLVATTMKAMTWSMLKTPLVSFATALVSPFLSLIVVYYTVRATIRGSKSPKERSARLVFGWKMGIATVTLALLGSVPALINVVAHPVLFSLSIVGCVFLPILIYVPLVLFWSFRHKRELEVLSAQRREPDPNRDSVSDGNKW